MAGERRTLPEQARKFSRLHQMLPRNGEMVLCALSGGADSVSLFHWLLDEGARQGFLVAAAHLNHQLRGAESLRDEDFVRQLVQELGGGEIPLAVTRMDVARLARQEKRGVEETARRVRYDFLQETAQALDAQSIATAHTADDNAETLLLHLTRGAGSGGLGAIAPKRGNIIRPLLTTSRQQVEDYLHTNGLTWVEDSSNADCTYTRNRLRHQVMPVLKEINPALLDGMGETAALLRREHDFLQELAGQAIAPAQWRRQELTIPAEHLTALPPALLPRVVQLLAQKVWPELVLSARQRREIAALAQRQAPSSRVCLPGGMTVRREYALLVFSRQPPPLSPAAAELSLPGELCFGDYCIRGEETVYQGQRQGAYEFWLDAEKAGPRLALRTRGRGDRLALSGGGKSVKQRMIDQKIPRFTRGGLPVFCCEEEVVAVAGLGADRVFFPLLGGRAWHVMVEKR